MSDRACHLYRTDRGGRLEAARMLSLESDERWLAGVADGPTTAPLAAARWVRQRLDASGRRARSIRELRLLVLDADGAACAWLTAPDADPALVRAMLIGASASVDEGRPPARLPDAAGETEYEPLAARAGTRDAPRAGSRAGGRGAAAAAPSRRIPVLALPDAPARLMLDELDRVGVEVERVISIWHAMALAWDPAAQGGRSGGAERVVADAEAPLAAVTLTDPADGRLLWCWSEAGALVACGSMRLRAGEAGREEGRDPFEAAAAGLTSADLGRLSAEWLSWAAQLGRAPARVVCVGALDERGEHTLGAGAFGRALAARWSGAVVDVIDEPDGVALTIRRLLRESAPEAPTRGVGPSQGSVAALAERPGRAHRAALRWGAVALTAAAIAVGARAWMLFRAAGEARVQRDGLRTALNEAVLGVRPPLTSAAPVLELETRAREAEARLRPQTGFPEPRAVLDELDALSFVLGAPGVELTNLRLDAFGNVDMRLVADSTEEYESIRAALRGISGSSIRWRDPSVTPRGGKLEVQFRGDY